MAGKIYVNDVEPCPLSANMFLLIFVFQMNPQHTSLSLLHNPYRCLRRRRCRLTQVACGRAVMLGRLLCLHLGEEDDRAESALTPIGELNRPAVSGPSVAEPTTAKQTAARRESAAKAADGPWRGR